jgi:hypothetical protein
VSFLFDLHSAAVIDSHIPCRCHAVAMPFPCHAVPLPCHEYAFDGRFVAWSRQGDGMRTAWERTGIVGIKQEHRPSRDGRWHVGHLPAFGFVLLPSGVPGRLVPDTYQSQMQVASVKQRSWQGRGRVAAGSRQGRGRGTAWERHSMCESALRLPDSVTSALESGRLSALRTGRLYPHFKRLSRLRAL